jgi:hypothetical protein
VAAGGASSPLSVPASRRPEGEPRVRREPSPRDRLRRLFPPSLKGLVRQAREFQGLLQVPAQHPGDLAAPTGRGGSRWPYVQLGALTGPVLCTMQRACPPGPKNKMPHVALRSGGATSLRSRGAPTVACQILDPKVGVVRLLTPPPLREAVKLLRGNSLHNPGPPGRSWPGRYPAFRFCP